MTVKKSKSQKRRVHIMKSSLAEVAPFDFSGTQDARIIGAMIALEATEGWACLRATLELQIKVIDEQIISKVGLHDELLDEAALDILRDRRKIYKEVIDTPRKMRTSKLKPEPEKGESLDPYYAEASEVTSQLTKK